MCSLLTFYTFVGWPSAIQVSVLHDDVQRAHKRYAILSNVRVPSCVERVRLWGIRDFCAQLADLESGGGKARSSSNVKDPQRGNLFIMIGPEVACLQFKSGDPVAGRKGAFFRLVNIYIYASSLGHGRGRGDTSKRCSTPATGLTHVRRVTGADDGMPDAG